jgi:hypothetical protein
MSHARSRQNTRLDGPDGIMLASTRYGTIMLLWRNEGDTARLSGYFTTYPDQY